MPGRRVIDVLVVEDSRVTRDYLVHSIGLDPRLRVSATADSGEAALRRVEETLPDVVLIDIHLRGMDGLETTRRIMASRPVPIVVCTASHNFDEVRTAMSALEAGALAAVRKPAGPLDPEADADIAIITTKLRLMSEVKTVRRWRKATDSEGRARPAVPALPFLSFGDPRPSIVAIGASTGGPPAIQELLAALPLPFPLPILVVQHIAPGFTNGFAEWISSTTHRPVIVARDGAIPLAGHVYVAPDGRHLRVGPSRALETTEGPPLHGMRPSASVLFRSVAETFGRRAIGVLLTGMGKDGADGLGIMARTGALTVAQDEASSVVFGMPAEAIRLGAAQHVLPPAGIAQLLRDCVNRDQKPEDGNGGTHG